MNQLIALGFRNIPLNHEAREAFHLTTQPYAFYERLAALTILNKYWNHLRWVPRNNFENLFSRIATRPIFRVTISQARVLRRKPEVHWCATYGEKQYRGDAIFSQGELNSCAMAFFLALATTNPQSLGFLLLDDPVQNMDEVHIEEFGNILKFIKDQLGWQLIIALHDESIYQYLKRQLYPSKGEQSLVAYTLEMGASGTEVTQDIVTHFDPRSFLASEVA